MLRVNSVRDLAYGFAIAEPDAWLARAQEVTQLLGDARKAHCEGDLIVETGHLEAALALDPHNSEALLNLSACYLTYGDASKTVSLLSAAIKRESSNARLMYNLALALAMLGREDDACALCLGYIEERGHDANIVRLLNHLGALDGVDALVCETAHDTLRSSLKRGEEMLFEGRLEETLSLFTALREQVGSDVELENNLGVVHLHKGDTNTAIRHFSAALQLDPGYRPTVANTMVVLQSLGDWEARRQLAQTYLANHPNDTLIRALASGSALPQSMPERSAVHVVILDELGDTAMLRQAVAEVSALHYSDLFLTVVGPRLPPEANLTVGAGEFLRVSGDPALALNAIVANESADWLLVMRSRYPVTAGSIRETLRKVRDKEGRELFIVGNEAVAGLKIKVQSAPRPGLSYLLEDWLFLLADSRFLYSVGGFASEAAALASDLTGKAIKRSGLNAVSAIVSRATVPSDTLADASQAEELDAAAALAAGEAAFAAGDHTQAEAAFKRVLAIEPQSPDAQNNLAVLYWSNEQTALASELFEALIRNPNADREMLSNVGKFLVAHGDLQGGERLFQSLVSQWPDDHVLRQCLTDATRLVRAQQAAS